MNRCLFYKIRFFILLISSSILVSQRNGLACSAVVLKGENMVFLAKNFDWTYGEGYLIKNVRGTSKKAFYTSEGTAVSWTSRYGSVTFNQNGKEMPYGGMNEKGLAVEMLWLDYTSYYDVAALSYLNELEWIQFQLDNYQSVAEVLSNLEKLSIRPFKGKIHYIVADPSGHSVVIEHIGGKILHQEKTAHSCQVITNYDIKSSENWFSNKANASKGNVTNALYRYVVLQSEIQKPQFGAKLSVPAALELMEDVAIKKGSFKTYWTIVYDLQARSIQFKSAAAKSIKQLNFDALDFDAEVQAIDVNCPEKGSVVSHLSPYDRVKNRSLITYSFQKLGLEQLDFQELNKHQFEFDVAKDNAYVSNYAALKVSVATADSSNLGRLGIVVVGNSDDFRDLKPFRDAVHQILLTSPAYSWVYYGLPRQPYAIAAAQDLNNNRRPDFELEKYAFSKDQRMVAGKPPGFDDCAVKLEQGITTVQLNLR